VIVRTRSSGEYLRVGANEAATLFDGGSDRRLTLLRSWSSSVVTDVVLGRLVADAAPTKQGGMLVLLAGRRPEAIEIDATERVEAVRELNQAMTLCEGLVNVFGLRIDAQAPGRLLWSMPHARGLAVTLSIDTSLHRKSCEEREYVLEEDGLTSTLYVRLDGSCQLEAGGATTEFASTGEFDDARPDLARRIGIDGRR
jgi:hypothetical protein